MESNLDRETHIDAVRSLGSLMRNHNRRFADVLTAEAEYVEYLGNLISPIHINESGFPALPSLRGDFESILQRYEKEEKSKDRLKTGFPVHVDPETLRYFLGAIYKSNEDKTLFKKEFCILEDEGTWFQVKDISESSEFDGRFMKDDRTVPWFVLSNIPETFGLAGMIYSLLCLSSPVSQYGAVASFIIGYGGSALVGKIRHPVIFMDIPSYIVNKSKIFKHRDKIAEMETCEELAFIEGKVKREEDVSKYAYHHPAANNLFGLKFPVLVCKRKNGEVSLSAEVPYQEAISKEEELREYIGSMSDNHKTQSQIADHLGYEVFTRDNTSKNYSEEIEFSGEGIKKLLGLGMLSGLRTSSRLRRQKRKATGYIWKALKAH